jgi:hypothetical protein
MADVRMLSLRRRDGFEPQLTEVTRGRMVCGRERDEPLGLVVGPRSWIRQDGAGTILLDDADVLVRWVPNEFVGVRWPDVQVFWKRRQLDPAVAEPGE